jgi:hypothetical protein
MEVSGLLHVLATLTPGKEPPIPIGYEARWAPELVWTLWRRKKILAPSGNRTSTVEPIAIICIYIFIWFVRLLALRPLLACCASLG